MEDNDRRQQSHIYSKRKKKNSWSNNLTPRKFFSFINFDTINDDISIAGSLSIITGGALTEGPGSCYFPAHTDPIVVVHEND